jgi:hypothetical protein
MTKTRLLAIALVALSPNFALAYDLNGTWTCTSVCLCGEHPGPGKPTNVAQTNATSFTFVNECGIAADGSLDADTGKIKVPAWSTTASPSPDGKKLTFGNGTIWTKQTGD